MEYHHVYYDPADPTGSMQYIDPLPENPTREELDEYQRVHFRAAIGYAASLLVTLVVVAVVSLLTGCTTTRYVRVPVMHADTLRMVSLYHDSIFRHDSIFINQYVCGDTVYQLKERWHTASRSVAVHDTAYVSRRDTISLVYPVEKPVAKPLSRWQNFQIWVGRMAMIALALAAAVWIVRKRNWWIGMIERLKK